VETAPQSATSGEDAPAVGSDGALAIGVRPRRSAIADRLGRAGLSPALARWRLAILVYLGSRVLLLLVAILDGALRHHALLNELANWDGLWYRWLANKGYPHHIAHCCFGNGETHAQSTLGFFPLYPVVISAVARPLMLLTGHSAIYSITLAGVIVSTIGGLICVVLVQELARSWWGESAGRRAAVLFCLFPGSIVFSMVYAEGIALPLAAGCILALQRRRWVLAGVLAGIATAATAQSLVLIPVCAISAGLELRRRGWGDRAARRSLLAPLLSVTGALAVGVFMWAWTGTPFAISDSQRIGWKERTDPLALVHLVNRLAKMISFSHFNHPTINLNLVVGVAGAIVLLGLLVLMWRIRRTISVEALAWTVGISLLAVSSEYVPPNPRMLITAFPAVIVLAYYLKGRAFVVLAGANAALLAGLSYLTFVGITLRP
jgi:Gpi18-like mannosyltransferase